MFKNLYECTSLTNEVVMIKLIAKLKNYVYIDYTFSDTL